MGDKIDFNAALEDCKRVRDGIKSYEDFQNADSGLVMYYLNTIVQALEIATTVKRGEWLDHNHTDTAVCSECGKCFTDETPYCPNCGADMRGVT